MIIDVKVPVLAESVAEATLMSWNKKAGDPVARGDSLIDIETDKVTLEIAAPNDGTLIEIIKNDGDSVESDEIIARIDTGKDASKPAAGTTPSADKPEQQRLPVDTEPQNIPVKLSPVVRNLLAEHNLSAAEILPTGEDGRISKDDVLNYIEQNKGAVQQQETVTPPPVAEKPVPPAPVAERPAAPPPGAEKPAAKPATVKPPSTEPEPVKPATDVRTEKRVPMTRLRRRAAERLLTAQHENALLTTFNEVNMQPVMDLRKRYREQFEKTHSVKLGFMSFFTKASVEALKKFPIINASVDGDDIIYRGYFDIGIAVSSPRGLVVPIVRDADLLSFAEIEKQIVEYGQKALDSKLTIEDLTGGTFTITNGGIFGSLLSTPIINPPQSAILGMHKIQERPVAENGQVVIRPMMYLALSYDHRIIDGRDAVQFLVTIKEQLEDPARLFLQI